MRKTKKQIMFDAAQELLDAGKLISPTAIKQKTGIATSKFYETFGSLEDMIVEFSKTKKEN